MSILDGLNMDYSSVTDSGISSALLTAATAFVGGSALGMWQGPEWTKNIFAIADQVGQASTDQAPIDQSLNNSVTAQNNATAGGPNAPMSMVNQQSDPGSYDIGQSGYGGSAGQGLDAAAAEKNAQEPQKRGFLSIARDAVDKAWNDDKSRNALITVGGNALATAFRPGPKDIADVNTQAQLERERNSMNLHQGNFNMRGVNLGIKPSGIISRVRQPQ